MKKLVLKISLLNFILAPPVLALVSNYNSNVSENYMFRRMGSLRVSKATVWSNDNYEFS